VVDILGCRLWLHRHFSEPPGFYRYFLSRIVAEYRHAVDSRNFDSLTVKLSNNSLTLRLVKTLSVNGQQRTANEPSFVFWLLFIAPLATQTARPPRAAFRSRLWGRVLEERTKGDVKFVRKNIVECGMFHVKCLES